MDVILFTGAGASAEFGIPIIDKMTSDFIEEHSGYSRYLNSIKKDMDTIGFRCHIENYLSYARGQINPLETILKCSPFISYFIRRLNRKKMGAYSKAKDLIREIEEYVYKRCILDEIYINDIRKRYHELFAVLSDKFSDLDYNEEDINIDIFTTNYDNIIEHFCHETGIQYYSGYLPAADGTLIYKPELFLEWEHISLYKLHGSVTQAISQNVTDETFKVVESLEGLELGQEYPEGHTVKGRIMIHGWEKDPSREPYFDFLNFLKIKLLKNNNVFVIGFSFEDDPITNIFKDVLNSKGENFKIFIMNDNSSIIKEHIFDNNSKIIPLNKRFYRCNELWDDIHV